MTRVACLVPFCRCSVRIEPGDTEGICAKHWRLVDRLVRRVYLKRKHRFLREEGPSYFPKVAAMWNVARKQAIERAMGI